MHLRARRGAEVNATLFSEPHACVKYLPWALTTDGEHHKQWAIEQAFRSLCADEYVDKAKATFEWKEGVAP